MKKNGGEPLDTMDGERWWMAFHFLHNGDVSRSRRIQCILPTLQEACRAPLGTALRAWFKRYNRNINPPRLVWMVSNEELQVVHDRVFALLFHGIQPRANDPQWTWYVPRQETAGPLVDDQTLLTAFLFNRERYGYSLYESILPPSGDRLSLLREFLPRPDRQDSRYMGLQTNWVRPQIDAFEHPRALQSMIPDTNDTYLVLVTDNVPEGYDPNLTDAYVTKHQNLKKKRQALFEIVIPCVPSDPSFTHRIMIKADRIWHDETLDADRHTGRSPAYVNASSSDENTGSTNEYTYSYTTSNNADSL